MDKTKKLSESAHCGTSLVKRGAENLGGSGQECYKYTLFIYEMLGSKK